MGNHQIGRDIVSTAVAMREAAAIKILDRACEGCWGADAEFDDEAHPSTPFGRILNDAFAAGKDFITQDPTNTEWEHEEAWYDEVMTPFRNRYGLV